MNTEKVYILEDRGILYINGPDSEKFLQNLISNDIEKVKKPLPPKIEKSHQKNNSLLFDINFDLDIDIYNTDLENAQKKSKKSKQSKNPKKSKK